jgi:hypothetical protein
MNYIKYIYIFIFLHCFCARTTKQKFTLSGSLFINFCICILPLVNTYYGPHSPWFTGHFFTPSNSHKIPSNYTNDMKCESHYVCTADCPCWEAPLCYVLIY